MNPPTENPEEPVQQVVPAAKPTPKTPAVPVQEEKPETASQEETPAVEDLPVVLLPDLPEPPAIR